ncbi:MAG: hemolysin family protein [Candidatus Izimaplasma sp.]|nr:hemolysin family protein [Candidatus Izimaplasma bacterium]
MGWILLLIILLTSINGFFAGAEMALVKLTKREIDQLESSKIKTYLKSLKDNSNRYLSTIQVMITMAGFLSSAFAGANLKADFSNLLTSIGLPISETASLVIVTFLLSYFTLVFGELVPKRISLSNHIVVSKFTGPVVYFSMLLTRPFVWLLSHSTRLVLKIFGIKKQTDDEKISEHDIKEMILYGHLSGLYEKQERAMMERVFQFDDLTATMIMTPVKHVTMVDDNLPIDDIIDRVIHSNYSRIPVYHIDKDAIIGMLIVKDLLKAVRDQETINIHNIMHRPLIVFEDIKINDLLRKMKQSSMHLACLMTDDGKFIGVTSLEDILEEIVGNIYDEHDDVVDPIEKENEFTYYVDNDLSMDTLNHMLKIALPIEYDTVLACFNDNQEDGKCQIENIILQKEGSRMKVVIKE